MVDCNINALAVSLCASYWMMVGTWRDDVWAVMNSNRQQYQCSESSIWASENMATGLSCCTNVSETKFLPFQTIGQKSANSFRWMTTMVARITKAFQSAGGGGTIDRRLQRFSHIHSADIVRPCRMTATMKFHEHVYLMKQLFLRLIFYLVCSRVSIIPFQRDAECANVWFHFDEPRDLTSSSQPVICRSKDSPVFFY